MKKTFTLAELAELVQAHLIGNPDHCITGVDALDKAREEDASFLANPRYKDLLKRSNAGVICISQEADTLPGKNFLITNDPSRTIQAIAEIFIGHDAMKSGFTGIHPTAVIHPEATVSSDAHIGPYAVIDRGAVIGPRVRIMAHVSIGAAVQIGEDCILHPHSIVREGCILGKRVILQPGAVIGSCGFGYLPDAAGNHIKLEQLGNVILEDDVEIGANTTIDRARFKTTRICRGSKIDNLVQIGHNVEIGEHNIIVAQTGIAGSTKTGRYVIMGGQVGVVGHVEIGDHVILATRSGVSKDIPEAGKYNGSPVIPLSDYNRQQVHLRKIAAYVKQIESLEQRLKRLEENADR